MPDDNNNSQTGSWKSHSLLTRRLLLAQIRPVSTPSLSLSPPSSLPTHQTQKFGELITTTTSKSNPTYWQTAGSLSIKSLVAHLLAESAVWILVLCSLARLLWIFGIDVLRAMELEFVRLLMVSSYMIGRPHETSRARAIILHTIAPPPPLPSVPPINLVGASLVGREVDRWRRGATRRQACIQLSCQLTTIIDL